MDLISQPSLPAFIPPPLLKKGIYSNLFTNLKQDEQDPNIFYGRPTSHPSWGRLYGAVFLAQSLSAALLTTQPEQYYVHQLQSVFLKGGSEKDELQYKVTDLKVTPNFINKKVEAYQKGQLCFIALIALVSINESPNPSHSHPLIVSGTDPIDFKSLPDPNAIPLGSEDFYKESISTTKQITEYDRQQLRTSIITIPCLVKFIDRGRVSRMHGKNTPKLPRATFFIRLPQSANDTFHITPEFEHKYQQMIEQRKQPSGKQPQRQLTLQQQLNIVALTYISDYNMIPMSLAPHTYDVFPSNIQFSSLNHNITIINPNFNLFDDWLVFDVSSPFLANSRTQLTGTFFTRDGLPIAYVTQECIFRVHQDDILSKFPNPLNASGPSLQQIEHVLKLKSSPDFAEPAKL